MATVVATQHGNIETPILIVQPPLTKGMPPISEYAIPTHAVAKRVSIAPIWFSVTLP